MSTPAPLAYALITPAWNEDAHLEAVDRLGRGSRRSCRCAG